jgi:hypothetical protein
MRARITRPYEVCMEVMYSSPSCLMCGILIHCFETLPLAFFFLCSKQNMNTWAYVGDLEDKPQLSCVYRSQDAQNEFLSNPKVGIGEDYLDDDREKSGSTNKIVKGGMTNAQKDALTLARKKNAAVPVL